MISEVESREVFEHLIRSLIQIECNEELLMHISSAIEEKVSIYKSGKKISENYYRKQTWREKLLVAFEILEDRLVVIPTLTTPITTVFERSPSEIVWIDDMVNDGNDVDDYTSFTAQDIFISAEQQYELEKYFSVIKNYLNQSGDIDGITN